ncbi:hypothetical protein M1271_03470 [Patescibacteria group bacterium]|nr:hypothetical protein [Patescibacteria group bacterium]
MTGFLGNIGIDLKLLVAQIINFTLLLLILGKFLYKPMIEKVEKEERELSEARKEKDDLEKEKRSFDKEKERELSKLREESQTILAEAQTIAQKIRKDAQKMGEEDVSKLTEQAKEHLTGAEKHLREEIKGDLMAKFIDGVISEMVVSLDEERKKSLQTMYFIKLQESIGKLSPTLLAGDYTGLTDQKSDEEIKVGNQEMANGQASTLEYAIPLVEDDVGNLRKMIEEKFRLRGIQFTVREKKDLVAGFRLTLGGILIEENFFHDIKTAVKK